MTDKDNAVQAELEPHSFVTPFENGAIFTLNRPSKLNAITNSMLRELEQCLDELLERDAKLLVIAGSGDRAFSAGTDVRELHELSHDEQVEKCVRARNLFVRLSGSSIISVAAISGLAYGGGLELAMACTLRIATQSSTFSLPEVKLGLLPAYGGTQMLPAIVGRARALEIMLTGRVISADEALSIGLIHRISPHDTQVEDVARRFGMEIVLHSSKAVHAIRACVEASGAGISSQGLVAEAEHVDAVFGSMEALRGLSEFLARSAANRDRPRPGAEEG